MKFKIIFVFFLFLSIEFFAQSYSLNGFIRDVKTGKVLDGAVIILNNNLNAVSNDRGYYSFKNLLNRSYTVKVSRLGYKSLLATILVESESVTKDFSLEPSPIEFDEVLVNSSKTSKYLRNSPYSELLIDKTQIETRSSHSICDILKEQPGLSLLRDGMWGTEINIRGLNRENLVTLIDGNRIATSTDVAARLSMIDMNDVERIEVIKGASSSIYGSGATGGIINVLTKTPSMHENFMVNGSFTSGVNTVNKMFSSSGSINTGNSFWSSKISGSFRKAKNTLTPLGELKNSQFKDYGFAAALNIIPFENNSLRFNYQLFKAEDAGIPGASVFTPTAEVRYPDEKREMISAGYEVQNISKFFYKFSLKYSYQVIDRNVENIPHIISIDTIKAIRATVLKINPSATHRNNNFQIQTDFVLGENNNLVLGLDYWDRSYFGIREKFQKIETLASDGSVFSTTNKVVGEKPLPDSKYRSIGLFAQDDAALFDEKLFLTIGARIDKIYVNGESTLNPLYEIVNGKINYSPKGQKFIWDKIKANEISNSLNFGVKYSCTEKLDLSVSIGYSFRSPSLEERFQYIDQGGYVRIGDPSLKSEKGKSVDLGIRYYAEDFKFISSFFYNRFNDLVAEMPGTFEGRKAFIKTNIGEAQLYGYDFHSEYNFFNDYIFHVTGSFVKGDDITANSDLPGIPPFNGNAGIKFSLVDYFVADFSSTIFAQQNNIAPGEMKTPGYAYFNLSCASTYFKFGSVELQATGGVENIFNKDYRNHLSTTRGILKSEPGRNIFLKLNLKW